MRADTEKNIGGKIPSDKGARTEKGQSYVGVAYLHFMNQGPLSTSVYEKMLPSLLTMKGRHVGTTVKCHFVLRD